MNEQARFCSSCNCLIKLRVDKIDRYVQCKIASHFQRSGYIRDLLVSARYFLNEKFEKFEKLFDSINDFIYFVGELQPFYWIK